TYIFIRVQSDGKIIVGGSYSGTFGGLVRLNPDGSVDNSFIKADSADVIQVEIAADGKIVIAGRLCSNYCVIRVNPDGTADPTFSTYNQGQPMSGMALLPNGKIA